MSGPTNDSGRDGGGRGTEGAPMLPPEKVRALLETLSKVVPRRDDRPTVNGRDRWDDVPSKESGFETIAFYAPLCKNMIALLNDTVSKVAAEAPSLRVTFLCTPASEESVRGLVLIGFDGTDETEVERADRLLRRCEATLELMRLPIIRYGASTDTAHESSCNVLRSKL